MRYKLISELNPDLNYRQQILLNREIPLEEQDHYLNTTDNDINDYRLLGEDNLEKGWGCIKASIKNNELAMVIIDADADGFTSSAFLVNWLYDYAPEWVQNNVIWVFHKGKQHGIDDHVDEILDNNIKLVLVPDAGSNDLKQCKLLSGQGKKIVILDHHIVEQDNPYAILINNQNSDYPNKDFSGVGIVYQFCRYCEDRNNLPHYSEDYLDLLALGLVADMVSLRSIETKHLIQKGFKNENIHNPFIYEMFKKNSFKLGSHITPIGAAFYIVPFVNAICRSGAQEEKELVFKSMINYLGLKQVPSTKRGHALGEIETIAQQSVRVATNVKARQTKIEQAVMETLENKIKNEDLLKHQVILFKLKGGEVKKEVAGLLANKLMSRYQRPVCVLTEGIDERGEVVYSGSARGCEIVDIKDFRKICESTKDADYAVGHPSAFGLSIKSQLIDSFLNKTDKILESMPKEPVYYVDYIFTSKTINSEVINEIASLGDLWGQSMNEPLIAIQNIEITRPQIQMMKSNTVKIGLTNDISLIKFNMPDEDYEKILPSETGSIILDIVGRASINEWNGNKYYQILIEDIEIKNTFAYVF